MKHVAHLSSFFDTVLSGLYYPEDSTYLLALEPTATHYEVLEP